jgi:hypothetical protein
MSTAKVPPETLFKDLDNAIAESDFENALLLAQKSLFS